MSASIERLECRCLLSHTLPPELFAQPTHEYFIFVGGFVPLTRITSLGWGVEAPEGQPIFFHEFNVVMPAGPASPQFFQWAMSGQPVPASVRLNAGATGEVGAQWLLSGSPFITTYAQTLGTDGVLYDHISIGFQRLTYDFHIPQPGGGTSVTTLDWNFVTNTGTASPLVQTRYMSTSPDVPATIELGRGQLAVTGYHFEPTAGAGGPAPVNVTTVSGPEGPSLLGRMLTRTSSDFVYLQRDAQARPLTRTRFLEALPTSYSFFDSVQDDLPRTESFSYRADRAQLISYSYFANGNMRPPTSSGWNYTNNQPFNPAPVTAYIAPPTFGPRNTPLESVTIRFTHAVSNLTLAHFDFESLNSTGMTLTSSDGGLTWTIGNFAPQQTADGDYAIKLFALGSGITSGPNPLIGSTGIKWTLDTTAPGVTGAQFEFLTRQALRFSFSEDVGASLSVNDVVLENLSNATTIPTGAMALAYDAATDTATITFPGLANGTLPDGNYRATLASAGITDPAGNALLSDAQHDFFFLNADANRDARVNLADFNILAANFGGTNKTFSEGDFNYDGLVNLQDFNILASKFGLVLSGSTVRGGDASQASAPFATATRITDWSRSDDALTEALA